MKYTRHALTLSTEYANRPEQLIELGGKMLAVTTQHGAYIYTPAGDDEYEIAGFFTRSEIDQLARNIAANRLAHEAAPCIACGEYAPAHMAGCQMEGAAR